MRPLRHLLVPLDGSVFAESALPLALDLARRAGARVTLVTVHTPLLPPEGAQSVPPLDPGFENELKADIRTYHDLLRHRLASEAAGAGAGPLPPVDAVLLEGPVAETVASYAEGVGADLVVLTSHGRGGASRFWLGSVTDALVRRLDAPSLVVRPGAGPTPVTGAFRRVLVPVDGSSESALGADAAFAVAGAAGVEYVVLRVVTPATHRFTARVAAERLEQEAAARNGGARREIAAVEWRLRDHGAESVRAEVRVHPSPAAAIVGYAAESGADLIALATHGRGPVGRLLFGGVTDKVLRTAAVPVLVRHVGERRGTAHEAAAAEQAATPVGV